MVRFSVVASFVLTAALVAAFSFSFIYYRNYSVSATIRVEKGENISSIASQLKVNEVISDPLLFKIGVRIFGVERQIKAGYYRFDGNVTLYKVIMELTTGRDRLIKVTFPEGLTCFEVFELLEQHRLGSDAVFRQLFNEPGDLIPAPFKGVTTLEGFLFPDTYYFREHASEHEVLAQMTEHFKFEFEKAEKSASENENLTPYQILTLASLIEKETSSPAERPLISSVFRNRLKIHMRLDCDPTIIYALMLENRWDGNIRKKDISMNHPYNTYVVGGLPPGPIGNPGLASLQAAYAPATTNYLYFVSKNDGTHVFAEKYSEHMKNVKRYQVTYWQNHRGGR